MKQTEKQPLPAGFKLRTTLVGHTDSIFGVGWSPDGQRLASCSADATIKIWDAQAGQELQTLSGYAGLVYSVGWSPDGEKLASCSDDVAIKIWDAQTGQELQTLSGHRDRIWSVGWSPDGEKLASCSDDATIKIWDAQTGKALHTLLGHNTDVNSVEWSPDGQRLASASDDATIKIWDAQTGQALQTLSGHNNWVYSVRWLPDGQRLASASDDRTIRIWDLVTGNQSRILEGHTESLLSVSFSFDGCLLMSKAADDTVRLWRTDTWEAVALLHEGSEEASFVIRGSLFCPTAPVLATLGRKDTSIRLWDLDFPVILNSPPLTTSHTYANAKVVLLGDSGVGKSGLGLVLSRHKFKATESTHGRRVWTFALEEKKLAENRSETREILLWDLAGQPGYRLIHQLHLNEVAVALVLFDARNETDPLAGVEHWYKALCQAQRVQGNAAPPLKKFLVAARIDRGRIGISRERIQAVLDEWGFDGYFETSAKVGTSIKELKKAIKEAIVWEDMLPKVSSTALFQQIKTFLIEEKKQARRLISTIEDLYRIFIEIEDAPPVTEELPAQFETCIGRVEAAGLIKRLSFGRLVLLQPELLDAYASALIDVVKDEPDGLGHIAEIRVRAGDFDIPKDERIQDKQQEEFLLLAMVEDLLRHELVLREEGELIFPSQSTKENPDLPNPKGKAMLFDFTGPVLNIYATLAVRLANSGVFKKRALWKNAITYSTSGSSEYGIFLRLIGEGRGELTLFYNESASSEMRTIFEDYVHLHLTRHALPDNFQIRRITVCDACDTTLPDNIVQKRKERGFHWLPCPVCEARVPLIMQAEPSRGTSSADVRQMDRTADTRRDIQANQISVVGKKEVQDFDVFLCHHSIDKAAVKRIGEQLKDRGLLPWLDEWELRPGLSWQKLLEEQIGQIKSAAVFVGKKGVGPWQRQELDAFLREFAERNCPIIPVLLEDAPSEPQLPIFLKGMTWVDFRHNEPDPWNQLEWGITGKRGW